MREKFNKDDFRHLGLIIIGSIIISSAFNLFLFHIRF